MAAFTQSKGVCTTMCPLAEIRQRIANKTVDKFEQCTPGLVIDGLAPLQADGSYHPSQLFVKSFARSTADTNLQLVEHIRPPEICLRTIEYLETHVMDKDKGKADPRFLSETGEWRVPSLEEVYFFILGRYRMIAKDLTLQSNYIPVTATFATCLERISRYFILADSVMRQSDEFLSHHTRHNYEQYRNALSTLHHYYVELAQTGAELPNRPTFTGYLLLSMLDLDASAGEVVRFLRDSQLPAVLLRSAEVKFALDVAGSIREENYAKFFRLFRRSDVFQSSLLRRFVGHLRLQWLCKMAVNLAPPGKLLPSKKEGTFYSLHEMVELLQFEGEEDCLASIRHCQLPHSPGRGVEFRKQPVLDMLPTDRFNQAIEPPVTFMKNRIASKMGQRSLRDLCRG